MSAALKECGARNYVITCSYVLGNTECGSILVSNQPDALFSMYLFHFSTCFEQPSAHHQENQFINTSSGIYHSV